MHHGNQGIYTINTIHYETQLDPNKRCSIADSMPSSKNNIECDIENGHFSFFKSKKKASVIVDCFIVFVVIALILLIEFGVVPHRLSGYTCHDKKLSFEYKGDTIRISVLLSACYTIPLITVVFTEWKRYRTVDNVLFRRVWVCYKDFLVGITTMLILIEFIKLIVGEPRPHFLDTCKPNKEFNCTSGDYVTSYTCTNTVVNPWLIRDSSKSFPSGHAAMAIYTALFCVWYMQKCLPNFSVQFLKPLLQSLLLILSSWCALSRITDNRHHWWDVLFGAILGIIYSLYTIVILCDNFKKKTPRSAHSTCTLLTDTTNRNAASVVL